MAQKPLLHELLREDQEPFHLKSYITNKRSQLRTDTALQTRRRRPLLHENPSKRTNNLCKHACFFSFHASPDVRRSPFPDLPSPAKSPCKSPNAAVFLHIPSRTAALLVEAAMRIQKQQQQQRSKPKAQPRTGFGLLGSLLKRLKDRSKNRKRAIGECDFNKVSEESEIKVGEESVGMSCSCSNRRLSGDWTENHERKSLDFEASTSSRASDLSELIGGGGGDFFIGDDGTCYCSSPFRFSLQQSPSSTGRRTPDFRSPSASPSRRVKQEKEKLDNVQGEEEEEKEQCSPVSVLDPPFDEDDEHESRDAEEDDKEDEDDGDEDDDDYDMECSYENVQRAKNQLLHRLRRFEMLADLDPVELERKLLEGSDDEGQVEIDGDQPVLNQSNFNYHSADMKRLVSDLIVEEKREMFQSCGNDVVMGRIRNRLDSWKGVEFDTIDMMIGLDFKKEANGWAKFSSQVEETAAEIEGAIYVQIIEELTEDLGI